MNAPTQRSESTALSAAGQFVPQQTSSLMLSPQLMQQMMAVATAMSEASITVPLHFRGKPGDCLAVVMQATQWNMNPFAVAQKTHVVNGTLGYEAQLVNAVLDASGAVDGAFKYEYRGENNQMECRVGAVCRGDRDYTWGEWLSVSSVTTKNSPLWKTNPKQQMGYLQVKNWARAFKPGAILGVYTTDELAPPVERHMGAADEVQPGSTGNASAGTASEIGHYSQEQFLKNSETWKGVVASGRKTHDQMIAFIENKGVPLSDAQKAAIRTWPGKATATESKPAAEVTDAAPKVTFAQVADALNKAANVDALAVAGDLIKAIPDEQQRTELQTIFDRREAELA